MKKVSERLEAGRDHLKKYGWCQRRMGNARGSACAVGALYYTSRMNGYDYLRRDHEAEEFLKRVIGRASIPSWNDYVAKDCCEVIEVYEKAIGIARVSEQPSSEGTA